MTAPREIRQLWERRFPAFTGKWTHWKLCGDGTFLAVVDSADLLAAVGVVEEKYERYTKITVSRVTVDENGNAKEQDLDVFCVSDLANDGDYLRYFRRGDA